MIDLALGQIVSQIIAFLIMLWVLKRYAWKPLFLVLDERKKKIALEFSSIEEQKIELKRLAITYNEKLSAIQEEGRIKIQEAIHQGQLIAQQIQNTTHQQAKEIILKAQKDAQQEVIKAKYQLKDEIVAITMAAVEKLLREKLNGAEHQKLIVEVLKESQEQLGADHAR